MVVCAWCWRGRKVYRITIRLSEPNRVGMAQVRKEQAEQRKDQQAFMASIMSLLTKTVDTTDDGCRLRVIIRVSGMEQKTPRATVCPSPAELLVWFTTNPEDFCIAPERWVVVKSLQNGPVVPMTNFEVAATTVQRVKLVKMVTPRTCRVCTDAYKLKLISLSSNPSHNSFIVGTAYHR